MIEFAERAVEATLAAGASDAEAYAAEDTGREVRVHGGAVESLTAATQRGVGIRAWIGQRGGYAYGTDLSGGGHLGARRSRRRDGAGGRRRRVRRTSPSAGGGRKAHRTGAQRHLGRRVAAGRLVELALAIERAALDADSRVVGVEQAVYAD